jgi:hypothetical protein
MRARIIHGMRVLFASQSLARLRRRKVTLNERLAGAENLINHLLTITVSRLQVIRSSNGSQIWALSYSNVLRQDTRSQLGLKPSPSAFAVSLKHGSKYTVPSAGTSMERRYGSIKKLRLQCASAKMLRPGQTQIESYARRSA